MTLPLLGQQYDAGLGVTTVLPSMDWETYSEAGFVWDGSKWRGIGPGGKGGIQVVGTWAYAQHPSTEITSLAYDLKTGIGVRHWKPGDPDPVDLWDWIQSPANLIEAFNSQFEYAIWLEVAHKKLGWPMPRLEQFRDVAAKAAAFGTSRKLETAGVALKTPVPKDTKGAANMRAISRPRTPTANMKFDRFTPENTPDRFQRLYEYNVTDVVTEDSIAYRCPDLSDFETNVFLCDQEINARGVALDHEAIQACQSIVDQYRDRLNAELRLITNDTVTTSDKVPSLKKWMGEKIGHEPGSLDKDGVEYYLGLSSTPPIVKRALEIRQQLGLASVKKLKAMAVRSCADGRIRDIFQYAGACRTWRWIGAGVQPQNIASGGPMIVECSDCDAVRWVGIERCHCGMVEAVPVDWGIDGAEAALVDIQTRDLDLVITRWGDPLLAVSGCLRSLFVASPGHDLICSDYSAIEACVLAEVAGEEWRRIVFRTHRKIYEASAAQVTGIPFAEIEGYKETHGRHHPKRKLGKVAELASGYGGGVGAWMAFGADSFMTESEIDENVLAWRKANPEIVKFWYRLQDAAVSAIENPGVVFPVQCRTDISYVAFDGNLYCKLPSGRYLTYQDVEVVRREQVSKRTGNTYTSVNIRYWGVGENKQWVPMEAWGGKLCENVIQAICRDILAHAMLVVTAAGYKIVLHVHDELVAEISHQWGSIEEFESLMMVMPDWASDWPITAAGGWRGRRYRKD